MLNASPAAPPNLMHPLIAEFIGVYDLPVRPKLGWTDVARFAAHGIAALQLRTRRSRSSRTPPTSASSAPASTRASALLEAFLGIG